MVSCQIRANTRLPNASLGHSFEFCDIPPYSLLLHKPNIKTRGGCLVRGEIKGKDLYLWPTSGSVRLLNYACKSLEPTLATWCSGVCGIHLLYDSSMHSYKIIVEKWGSIIEVDLPVSRQLKLPCLHLSGRVPVSVLLKHQFFNFYFIFLHMETQWNETRSPLQNLKWPIGGTT